MNLKDVLLEEHSKAQCNRIVAYIGADRKKFAILMDLFFNGEYRIAQRAAWPMSYSVHAHPELIGPYLDKMIKLLGKDGQHNAVTRNTLRLLQDIYIPKKLHGRLMNNCFEFIQSNDTPVAIKAFSLTVLQNLSKDYPEISAELKYIIQDRWEHETPAFHQRAKRILKKL
jgi:hypothetical protein